LTARTDFVPPER